MKKKICDICKKVDNYCSYEISKKWKLTKFYFDSQGGSNFKMDICDDCFHLIKKFKENKLRLGKIKPPKGGTGEIKQK